jgi:phosphonate transport system substrate-binding protein
MIPVRACFGLLFGLVCCAATVCADEPSDPLTFGIVPQQSAARLAALWGPILAEVGQRSGVGLEFRTAPDIPTFEQRLADGVYDLAYMNPYHYRVFSADPGYRAFAKQRDKRIRGILVTRRDAAVDSIEALAGTQLAFPAPAAFAASILPRAALTREGIDVEPNYVRSHDSVYRAVAQGLYPAGGGIERTFENTDPTTREQLQVLWRSQGFTPHAFAAHPRVDPEPLERVREAMLGLNADARGQTLLDAIGFQKGIASAEDADWDDVRALQIDLPGALGGKAP